MRSLCAVVCVLSLPGCRALVGHLARVPGHASIGRHRVQRPGRISMGLGDFIKGAQAEFDNFLDDAINRRLGGGSTFYGERKSNFSPERKEYKDIAAGAAQSREDAREVDAIASRSAARSSKLGGRLSGADLRGLIIAQWGRPFPVLIKRKRDALAQQRLYLVIQWKALGARNLNLSEEEYVQESDAVASLLTEWGVANEVRREIQESTAVPKTMTQQFPGLFILLDVEERVIQNW